MAPEFDAAIAAHYGHDPERDRLDTWARLEGIRTRELLSRFLPAAPAVVLDVGGARGVYALELARENLGALLDDPTSCDAVLRAIRRVEDEPALLAASAHFMAVGRVP